MFRRLKISTLRKGIPITGLNRNECYRNKCKSKKKRVQKELFLERLIEINSLRRK
jgi:hypothetical protein